MDEPQELTLHRPDALQQAIDLMSGVQASPFGSHDMQRTLDALNNGDVGTALFSIDLARHYTLTRRKETDAVAALIRQAFDL